MTEINYDCWSKSRFKPLHFHTIANLDNLNLKLHWCHSHHNPPSVSTVVQDEPSSLILTVQEYLLFHYNTFPLHIPLLSHSHSQSSDTGNSQDSLPPVRHGHRNPFPPRPPLISRCNIKNISSQWITETDSPCHDVITFLNKKLHNFYNTSLVVFLISHTSSCTL